MVESVPIEQEKSEQKSEGRFFLSELYDNSSRAHSMNILKICLQHSPVLHAEGLEVITLSQQAKILSNLEKLSEKLRCMKIMY